VRVADSDVLAERIAPIRAPLVYGSRTWGDRITTLFRGRRDPIPFIYRVVVEVSDVGGVQ
jgi:hypothetical protein